ncbi:hypothetical protein PHLCEN_2v3872 [Hermanssonia centrifuga]|uniref:Vacuolar sorting protein n=1 Tax=Hermanssonia centrifuga TaxID=98765 RepID=A0A2R6QB66_9APHY|nr:hypothetical protein PHLCEN_2v3872 [Hermanssonia centrifuga]
MSSEEDRSRAKEFVELHDQVQVHALFPEFYDVSNTSITLLDSLETFLSTFQKDLSAVSGQISDLQDRSKDIENRLKSRRKIEKPLSHLIADLTIPPPLATIILDTNVGEPWISTIAEFERRLDSLKMRGRVKAARDLSEVAEGLRIVAATKLRQFFLSLLTPMRNNMSTNISVIQSSIFLKYRSLYAFLQRQASPVAGEVQRAYIGVARTYFETGFRRYIRSLGWIKARATEKVDTIVIGAGEYVQQQESEVDVERLAYARIDGPGPVLSYMADDKTHKEPPEALLRSLLLVLLDNGTSEYTFLTAFFSSPPPLPRFTSSQTFTHTPSRPGFETRDSNSSMLLSPPQMVSPTRTEFDELRSLGSETGFGGNGPLTGLASPRRRVTSINNVLGAPPPLGDVGALGVNGKDSKEEQASMNAIWKQVMDPVLEYCQVRPFLVTLQSPLSAALNYISFFLQTYITQSLAPHPTIPLLTIIRLTEDVMLEVQKRGCQPLETFIFTMRLKMWPVWQKGMADHIDGVKRMAEGTGAAGALAGMWTRKVGVTEAAIKSICQRYVIMFNSFVALSSQQEETMIFSNLLRLRQELTKLIASYTDKITDPVAKATAQSTVYDALLQGLSKGPHLVSHPKAQSEIAFWREREEEARRRIVSTRRQR